MALSDEEKAQLAALEKKAKEPDVSHDEDDEVEWYVGEGKERRGGKMKWKRAKSVYGQFFPDLFGEKPPEPDDDDDDDDDDGDPPPPKSKTSEKFFGRGEKK